MIEMRQPDDQSQNRQLIAVITPFPIKSIEDAHKYLTKQDIQKMTSEQQNINLTLSPLITLSKRKPLRSLYQIRTSQYKHKQTGELIQIIEQSNQITKIYDYTKMCDFYIADNQSSMSIDQIKNLLKNKILHGDNLDHYQFVATPSSFLKSFNLGLPTSDLLVNKSEGIKKLGKSKNICFGEALPKPPENIPEYVTSLKIFPIVQEYLKKRPCWLRNVLQYQLRLDGQKNQYTTNELKNILKFLCFTYRDGPWKHVFCRFGYNPTTVNQGALYQILMVKIKRKQVEDYDEKDENSHQQSDIYDPTLKEIPKKYLRIYQLCDIEDKRLDDIIKNTRISLTNCNKQQGWFTKNDFNQIQQIVKNIREERSTS